MSHAPLLLIAGAAAVLAVAVVVVGLLLPRGRRLVLVASGTAAVVGLALTVGVGLPGLRVGVARASAQSPQVTVTATPSAVILPTWHPAVATSGPSYPHIARLSIPAFPTSLRSAATQSDETMPTRGEVGSVVIPATRSHFVARPAIVYLPPAARVLRPQLLPVVVMFSGQSKGAGPRDLVWSAHLESMMDAIAAKHHGVAPIVVVPDQLGPASGNPMCVDSKDLGNSATYVMTDVRQWILTHLPVKTDRREWTVAGFSQGGTCSIQFAAAHPDVFGSFIDVSGEQGPFNRSLAHTIAAGFGGSAAAYERATPFHLLATHHYSDEVGYFAAGALDGHYGAVTPVMAAHAKAAGITVHVRMLPGLRHNWLTGSAGLAWGLNGLVDHWGI